MAGNSNPPFAGGPAFKFIAAVAIGTETTVWTPTTATLRFRLTGAVISVSANASIIFKDNTAGATIFQTPVLLANTPFILDLGEGMLSAAANNVLTATASAAANLTGTLFGRET